MANRVFNVLFLCTHNSARSIMAEALLNTICRTRFQAFSAGSVPSGRVNPFALDIAKTLGYLTENIRSKSWDEFAKPGAPHMDIIITVCDNADGEACPFWPGHPATAHWGFPDPASVEGSDDEKRRAFNQAFQAIRRRIDLLVSLPSEKLEHLALADELKRIHTQ